MKNRQFYIYILASYRGSLYIGFTSNLSTRVEQHRSGSIGGHSGRYRTTKLVYAEVIDNAEAGIAREKQLKSWRREKKVNLIEATNPYWEDLSSQIL